jgi:hypothetical protein
VSGLESLIVTEESKPPTNTKMISKKEGKNLTAKQLSLDKEPY